jgi:hypothetical protein
MRKILLVLVSLALLFSCDMAGGKGTGLVSEPDVVIIPDDFLGLCHAGFKVEDLEYDFIDYMGARWVQRTFNWRDIESGTKGNWQWTTYDDYVNGAIARGYKIFAVLAYANNWTVDGSANSLNYITPPYYEDYCNFVKAVIARYGDKISGYSIWNEPNENPRFWTGTAKEMWDLTTAAGTAARQAINQYNPGGKLVGGVLNVLAPDMWTRGFFVSGAMAQMDGIGFHPYMPNGNNAYLVTKSFNDVVNRYGFADRIWITEMGFPTNGQYSSCVEEDRMPEEVVKTIVLLATGGAARHIFWYQTFDPIDDTSGSPPNPEPVDTNSEDWFGFAYYKPPASNRLGINNPNGITKKKGADAYALCARYIQGTTYRRDLAIVSGVDGAQAYYFEGENGARTLVLWSDKIDATATTPVRVKLPGSEWKQYSLGDAGVWNAGDDVADLGQDLSSGDNVYALGKTPLFFTWTADSALPSVTAP